MASNPELLKKLDRILMSDNPTVLDALQQVIVLAEVSKENEENINYGLLPEPGPLEAIHRLVMEYANRIHTLERELHQIKYRQTGTYYTNTTGAAGANGPYWSETGYGAIGTLPADLTYSTSNYFNNLVMPSSPTDPDAFILTDPDTGDSMSVKYK